mmetsp:Transcript_12794/g.27595  ORF Transcript_12794/g.27595 Transcript_12794/m.27595 type:complete len:221 (-) Transcript_12794:20-682(-)
MLLLCCCRLHVGTATGASRVDSKGQTLRRDLVVALQNAEEVREGEERDGGGARKHARRGLHGDERGAVVRDREDEAGLGQEEYSAQGEKVASLNVEQALDRTEDLKVVGEGEKRLDLAEGTRSLQLGEHASLLGARQKAGLGDGGEKPQLLQALKQLDRRLLHGDFTALKDAIRVEGDNLLVHLHGGHSGAHAHSRARKHGRVERGGRDTEDRGNHGVQR